MGNVYFLNMHRILFCLLAVAVSTVFAASEIEKEILAEPVSSNEKILRGRQLLYKALNSADFGKAFQLVEYLDGFDSESPCPFSGMEKGMALLHMQKYDSAMAALVQGRRLFAPDARSPVSTEERCIVKAQSEAVVHDDLHLLLQRELTKTPAQIDSLIGRIAESSVEPFYKDAAPAFIPIVFTPSFGQMEASRVEQVLEAGEAFVQKYPMNADGAWLEKNFLQPFRSRRESAPHSTKDPFDGHLYGSGIGMEILTGIGFLTGDLKSEFHHKFWDFYAAIPIQLYRAVFTPFISFGTVETRKNRQFKNVLWEEDSELSVYEGGISLGFVLFDHRLFKCEPFVGIALAASALPDNSDDYYYFADRPNNNYHRLRDYIKSQNSTAYLLGVTGEFRLLTAYSKHSNAPLNSISLRVKYVASYLDHDFGYAKMDGFSHKVLAGVGFFLW